MKQRENPYASTTLMKQTGNPGQTMEHGTQDRNMETATTTDKQQLKHRGLNTNANKLNKITRGRGK